MTPPLLPGAEQHQTSPRGLGWPSPMVKGAEDLVAALFISGLLWSLSGCALPREAPLPTSLSTATRLSDLSSQAKAPTGLPLPPEAIDPAAGLTPVDVAILAVLNSPDLKAKRAAAHVAAAQVFAAKLLPDPQVSLSADLPTPGQFVAPGQAAATAFGIAPSLDIAGMIAHAPALAAARATRRQADLELLWAEWGVAQQARALAETALAEEARLPTLDDLARAATLQAAQSKAALSRGELSLPAAVAAVSAKIDATTQAAAARQIAARARLDLNALIGLRPDVILRLRTGNTETDWDAAAVDRARATVAERRPDLLALKAGYESQEATLRRAVLAQFPLLNVGLNHAMDNTGIVSNGPQATLTLPIFRTARGPVAIEDANRAQLRAEYQARLDQADADAAAGLNDLEVARAQDARLNLEVPHIADLAASSKAAFAAGDIDGPTYLAALQTYAGRLTDASDRALTARLAEITLETVLFLPPALETQK